MYIQNENEDKITTSTIFPKPKYKQLLLPEPGKFKRRPTYKPLENFHKDLSVILSSESTTLTPIVKFSSRT